MPDLEISNLPELTGAALAATDPFAVADLSASETKRITAKNLVQSGLGLVDDASIPAAKVAALGATQLANNSVTTDKIADSAVSTAKIEDAGVTDAKVATGLSGAKLSNASVTAAKLGTVTDRGLDQVGGSVGHTNSLTAGTASGISFDAQGHVTATTSIPAADLPAGTTTAIGGVSVPSGSGLTVSASGVLDHESSIASGTTANIAYDEHGHILSIEAIGTDDLPVATTVEKGAVSVPASGKLEVSATGVLSLSDTAVTPGVHAKVTVDAQGRVTSGTGLDAADIPDLDVNKLTTGQLQTVRIADDAVTAAKLADRSTATIAQTTPANGAFIGQTHLNSITGDYFLWDGNVWQPIGISVGEIVLAGTYNATTNLVATVTAEGTALGFVVGSALPSAASANKGYYVVVSTAGTGSAPAPVVALNPPDFLLSTGSVYTEIDVSSTVTAQQASNIAFTASGSIASTNVQSAIEELDTEKAPAASPTLTGTVTLDTDVTLVFEGATDNEFETTLTVVDPTADRTIALPDVSGTVVSTGDTGTVTSAMIADATIVNDDVNASAAIAGTKISPDFGSQTIATTGVINSGSGTAAAPSVSVGTADNGLYSPATDEVGISTNGVQRLAIDSSGNVGIGTSSPAGKLDIRTSAGTACQLFLNEETTTNALKIEQTSTESRIQTQATQPIVIAGQGGTGSTSDIRFETRDTERVRISADGSVGIGTSSPSRNLEIKTGTGIAGFKQSSSSLATTLEFLRNGNGTISNNALEVNTSEGTKASINYGGGAYFENNVGIGNDSPANKLSVRQSAVTNAPTRSSTLYLENNSNCEILMVGKSTNDCQIRFGTSGSSFKGAIEYQLDNNALLAYVDSSERMRIDASGNVGIGTSSPGGKLGVQVDTGKDVTVGLTAGSPMITYRNGTNTWFHVGKHPTSDALIFSNGATTTTSEMARFDSSGNVFIGGTTAASADIALNANGSATFTNRVDTGSSTLDNAAIVASANHATKGVIQAYHYSNGNLFLGGGSDGVTKAEINADGSATFAGTVTANGTVLTSDLRFKENITPANLQLADIEALGAQLKNFDWNADAPSSNDTRQLGLIAQDVETVCPGIVKTIARTKQGAELTPEVVVPAVYETKTVPAVLDEEGEVVEAETTEQVLVTEEQVTPATYEELDDSYKGISHDALIMKLLGAVAELSAKVAALEAS